MQFTRLKSRKGNWKRGEEKQAIIIKREKSQGKLNGDKKLMGANVKAKKKNQKERREKMREIE